MKKSKRASGNLFQIWVKKYLEEKGWEVENFPVISALRKIKDPKTGKLKEFYQRIRLDPFDCDLIAKKAMTGTLWVQATEDTNIKRKTEKLLTHPWDIRNDNVQIWVKRKPGEIDIFRLFPPGEFLLHAKIIRRKYFTVDPF